MSLRSRRSSKLSISREHTALYTTLDVFMCDSFDYILFNVKSLHFCAPYLQTSYKNITLLWSVICISVWSTLPLWIYIQEWFTTLTANTTRWASWTNSVCAPWASCRPTRFRRSSPEQVWPHLLIYLVCQCHLQKVVLIGLLSCLLVNKGLIVIAPRLLALRKLYC